MWPEAWELTLLFRPRLRNFGVSGWNWGFRRCWRSGYGRWRSRLPSQPNSLVGTRTSQCLHHFSHYQILSPEKRSQKYFFDNAHNPKTQELFPNDFKMSAYFFKKICDLFKIPTFFSKILHFYIILKTQAFTPNSNCQKPQFFRQIYYTPLKVQR